MNFSSLLSDHEQQAFSAFLGQLAQEERYRGHDSITPGPVGEGMSPPSQHPLQYSQQRQSQPLLPPLQSPSSLSGDFSRPIDSTSAQAQQQQRDWIQQISSNPLLAPGGVIDPHAMSQAFLQNPELMAQANAISQAMVLAQQQQMQQQLQQQQLRDQQLQQQEQVMLQQRAQQHRQDSYEASSYYQQNSPPGQHTDQQRPQYHSRDSNDASSHSQLQTPTKRKSQNNIHVSNIDHHEVTPPLPVNGNSQHTGSESYSSSPNGYYEAGYATHSQHPSLESADRFGPPAKKTTGRKGSFGMDSHRSSRDGHDSTRTNAHRKTSGSLQHDLNGRRNDYAENRDGSEDVSFSGPIQEYGNGLNHDSQLSENDTFSPTRQRRSPSGGDMPRARSSSTGQVQEQRRTSSKKAPHELLTEAEKKANHIASEQKRRQNIRIGFDSLVEIVPTLSECHRSEALILQKSVDYIHRLLGQKNELKSKVRDLQANLGELTEDNDSASDMEIELYH
ncbi:hypothetical protein EDD11_004164 [Mortierella claussenii]|nr:hypothetical protein EDD11_004164 [Mortierella claussenii]